MKPTLREMSTKPLLLLNTNFSLTSAKIWISVLITFLMNNSTHAQLNLVTNTTSNYSIVISATAGNYEKKAATVLQQYLRDISSANLPIITDHQAATPNEICVGKTKRLLAKEEFVADGFVIKTLNSRLFIYGENGHGALYGVYHFLEKHLGCKKFTPTLKYIPKLQNIQLPEIFDHQRPQFNFRQVYYPGQYDDEYRTWHKLHLLEEVWGLWGHTFDK
ncbi:MAG: hypothetical protein EOP00_23455, partial [Pedobacter sp.]